MECELDVLSYLPIFYFPIFRLKNFCGKHFLCIIAS